MNDWYFLAALALVALCTFAPAVAFIWRESRDSHRANRLWTAAESRVRAKARARQHAARVRQLRTTHDGLGVGRGSPTDEELTEQYANYTEFPEVRR